MDPVLAKQLAEFKATREYDHLRPSDLFETFATYCLVSRFRKAHFDPDQLRMGRTGDGGIDGAAILINGELCTDPDQVTDLLALVEAPRIQIIVVQAKLTEEFASRVFTDTVDAVDRVFTAPTLLPGSAPRIVRVRQCVDRLFSDRAKIAGHLPSLLVYYATPGEPPARGTKARRYEESRAAAEERLRVHLDTFKPVAVHGVGGGELREFYKRATEALKVSLTMPRQRRAELPTTPGVKTGLLGTVAAANFVEKLLHDESRAMRQVLFDDNVRDWLSAREADSVNAQIQGSLRDPEVRGRFAVMNNGVTILAKSVELVKDSVVMVDPRIINGCQTSNVLFDAYGNGWLDDRVMVAVRILQLDDKGVEEEILVAANRQNAIDPKDLDVRSALHREIEQHFEAQPPARRLYYERRPGQYNRLDIKQSRVVNRADLARAYAATFLGDNSRLWRVDLTPERSQEIFAPETPPVMYFAAASAHVRLEALFKRRQDKLGELRPTRYVLMRALAQYLLGAGGLPAGRAERKALFASFLDTVWVDQDLETAVDAVSASLWAEVNRVKIEGGDLTKVARTQRFGDLVCASIRSRV